MNGTDSDGHELFVGLTGIANDCKAHAETCQAPECARCRRFLCRWCRAVPVSTDQKPCCLCSRERAIRRALRDFAVPDRYAWARLDAPKMAALCGQRLLARA